MSLLRVGGSFRNDGRAAAVLAHHQRCQALIACFYLRLNESWKAILISPFVAPRPGVRRKTFSPVCLALVRRSPVP